MHEPPEGNQKNSLPKHHWNEEIYNSLAQDNGNLRGKINSSILPYPNIHITFSLAYIAPQTILFHEPKERVLSGCCLSGNYTKQHMHKFLPPSHSALHVTNCLPNILCFSILKNDPKYENANQIEALWIHQCIPRYQQFESLYKSQQWTLEHVLVNLSLEVLSEDTRRDWSLYGII